MTLGSDIGSGAWDYSPVDNLTHSFTIVGSEVQEQHLSTSYIFQF